MTLDLAQLRVQLREGLGLEGDDTQTLPNTDTSSQTGADTYLNRAYWELLDKFKFREKETSTTIATVDGTREYNAPSPFEAVQKLSIEDPDSKQHTPLDRMELDEYEREFVNNADQESKPRKYLRRDDKIRFWPTPDKVYTVTVYYWTTLADLQSTGPDIPQNWHEIVLFGALWRALIGVNGDYSRARELKYHQGTLVAGISPVEDKEKKDSPRAGVELPSELTEV